MCLAQITRYDILCAVNQLAEAMSKPAKAHMGAAIHLLCYLAESTDFSITTSRTASGLQSSQMSTGAIHRDADQRSDHLQSETVGTDRTIHIGCRACGGSSGNEGGGVLPQHDVGAGLR